jgi:hypothetical protein
LTDSTQNTGEKGESSKNKVLQSSSYSFTEGKTKQGKRFQKFDIERVVIKLVPVKERLNNPFMVQGFP